MKDEEVGEIWKLAYQKNQLFTGRWRDHAVDLIVKLVEEHQRRHGRLDLTLAHFGIKPATWPKEGA